MRKASIILFAGVLACFLFALFFWFAHKWGGPSLQNFANLGEAMNAITLPILACSIYFAALQFSDSRSGRLKSDREKRLADLMDAKVLAEQRMVWQLGDNVGFEYLADDSSAIKGSKALPFAAQFIRTKFFQKAVLSDRITKSNSQKYHPNWDDKDLTRFQIATSAYAEVIRLILAELKSWPTDERDLALMSVANRISADEATMIYFAASTLPLTWNAIRNLIMDVGFFRWMPEVIALRFNDCWREGHIPPLDDRAFSTIGQRRGRRP
jgi:hypothetical protein